MLVYTLLAHKFRHLNPHTRHQTHQSLSLSMTKFGAKKKERKIIKIMEQKLIINTTGKKCCFPIIFHWKLFHYAEFFIVFVHALSVSKQNTWNSSVILFCFYWNQLFINLSIRRIVRGMKYSLFFVLVRG